MGATASTPSNIVIGAGNVLVDSTDVGVTNGDNVFHIDETMFEPDDLNGVPGMLIGTQYITRQEAILEAGMPEVTAETVALLLKGSQETGGVIDWDATRRVPLANFHDYELVVDGLTSTFHFLADNALNQATAQWSGQDAGMMSPRGEFHSKWDAADLTASPHRIIVAALGS